MSLTLTSGEISVARFGENKVATHKGRITKPLRHNGMPYNGINVLMLWGASVEAGNLFPYWMTYRQAKELGAHVKKGERGNLVV